MLRAKKIRAEDQSPRRSAVPAPFGDFGEKITDRMHASDAVGKVIGAPVTLLTVVVNEVMKGSMCRRLSSTDNDVMSGSMTARYLPKCANLVARLLTVLGTQVACLRFR